MNKSADSMKRNSADSMRRNAAESMRRNAVVFACFTWTCYCLLQKQWQRTNDAIPPITGFIHVPMQWLCFSLITDNVRLLLGTSFGKDGASVFLGQLWQLMHMIGLPMALSAQAAMFGYLIGFPWLRYLGGSAAVFYVMNGLNQYVSTVHGSLIYTEEEDVPRYTVDKHRKPREGEQPVLLLSAVVMNVISAIVTFIAMVVSGDVIPFLLQVLTIIGQFIIPTYPRHKRVLVNLLHILSLASIVRTERYL